MPDTYLKMLNSDDVEVTAYYRKSITKTEQQKFLERLLLERGDDLSNRDVADLACGGATLTRHLNLIFPGARFYCLDYNPSAIQVAAQLLGANPAQLMIGDLFRLPFADNTLDYVFCWQTLSWLEDAEAAIKEITRVLKPGGKLYASSLFNLDFDVDLYTKVIDHSRRSGAAGVSSSYYTYAVPTVARWLNEARDFEIKRFVPEVDFDYKGRGMGSFTLDSDKGKLQISGGLLMHWAILIATK
jgi:ubiquinone/menaquinone biosynthesis C-methylase UbiE